MNTATPHLEQNQTESQMRRRHLKAILRNLYQQEAEAKHKNNADALRAVVASLSTHTIAYDESSLKILRSMYAANAKAPWMDSLAYVIPMLEVEIKHAKAAEQRIELKAQSKSIPEEVRSYRDKLQQFLDNLGPGSIVPTEVVERLNFMSTFLNMPIDASDPYDWVENADKVVNALLDDWGRQPFIRNYERLQDIRNDFRRSGLKPKA